MNGREIRDFYLSLFEEGEIGPVKDRQVSTTFTCSANCDPSCKAHCRSIVHRLAVQAHEPPRLSPILIPPSNPGYQILTRMGWRDPEFYETPRDPSGDSDSYVGGLGRNGQGRRLPIPTVLKRDRSGIGCDNKSRPRITHFSPFDKRAVENPYFQTNSDDPLILNKKYRQRKRHQDRQIELRIRRELTLDDDTLQYLYG